jgi:hypothetical protein
LTGLNEEFCGNLNLNLQTIVLELQPISEATVYQTIFANSETNFRDTLEHELPRIEADQIEFLDETLNYTTTSRALVADQWTNWGTPCEIGFKSDGYDLNLTLYPNPLKAGTELAMMTKGDWQNLVIEVRDLTGRTLTSFRSNFSHMDAQTFSIPVKSKGVYLITARHANQVISKKLVVQ